MNQMSNLNLINIEQIPQSKRNNSNRQSITKLCPMCKGKGQTTEKLKCDNCEGYGIIPYPKFTIQSFKYSSYPIAISGGDTKQ